MDATHRRRWVVVAMTVGLAVAGCGLPGAPQPPSLNLPSRVTDLSAVRAGRRVTLHWTMPMRNTDKTLVKGSVQVNVCRQQSATGGCVTAGSLPFAPGANGAFSEDLPAPLASGSPRLLTYYIELNNSKDRSAGLSNPASVLAGEAPPPVTGLTVAMAKNGVILRWKPIGPAHEPSATAVRLQRTLITPPAARHKSGLLAPPPEPVTQNLLVPAGVAPGSALDKNIRFGETYEYRAQRILQVTIDGRKLELPGALSPPIRIHVVNVFPPAVPRRLVAVAVPSQNGAPPSIDLSWLPDAETNVTGYIVYRRQDGGSWQHISPAQPVVGPAFRDAHVEPGHTYEYAVSAVGRDGLESARSATAQETVPKP